MPDLNPSPFALVAPRNNMVPNCSKGAENMGEGMRLRHPANLHSALRSLARRARGRPPVPPPDAALLQFAQLVFAKNDYLQAYPDVAQSRLNPMQHFISFGEDERRNPSRLIDREFTSRVSQRNHEHTPENLASLEDIFAACSTKTLSGPSGLICPAWISAQLPEHPENLRALLEASLPEAPFSLHPALKKISPRKKTTVASALLALDDATVQAACLYDLKEYTRQHHDLAFLTSPLQTFLHMWTRGIFENRLKYLGIGVPQTASYDQLFLTQLAAIYQKWIESGPSHLRPSAHLPLSTIRHLDADDTEYAELLNYDCRSGEMAPDLATYLGLATSSAELPALTQASPAVARRKTITDQTLLSGTQSITSKRVVYGVNLGGYDNLPTPPELDDCSYFLITDRAQIASNSPWQLVRPTLGEADTKRLCLFYKANPHRLFPNADAATWVDSNIDSLPGAGNVIRAHETLSEVATFTHPDRNCIYEEAAEILKLRLDHKEVVENVVARLKSDKMPESHGLFETNVLFSQCGDPAVREFFETWWKLISLGSRRDQLSFSHAAFLCDIDVSPLEGQASARESTAFRKRSHRHTLGRQI